jgi:TonB family protein
MKISYLGLTLFIFHLLDSVSFAQGWQPKRIVGLQYPPLATLARVQGTVKLGLMIDGDGSVSSTKVLSDLETSGHKLLSDAAQLNVTRWKFARMDPNDKSSSPDTFTVTYTFRLTGITRSKRNEEFVVEYPNSILVTSEASCTDHLPCDEKEAKEFQERQKKSRKPYVIP